MELTIRFDYDYGWVVPQVCRLDSNATAAGVHGIRASAGPGRLYCYNLTDEDVAAGFRLGEVAPGVRGVVRRLGGCDRVVKVQDALGGGVRYAHERYGTWTFEGPGDPPKWRLAFEDCATRPAAVIELAQSRLAREAAAPILARNAP